MDISPEEKQRIRENIEKLKQSKFKQQTLPAWRPVPTVLSSMLQFAIFGIIFMTIGIGIKVMNDQITEMEIRYDDKCDSKLQTGIPCEIFINSVTERVEGPIYVYYQLD